MVGLLRQSKARAAVLPASDDASSVTGVALPVDGTVTLGYRTELSTNGRPIPTPRGISPMIFHHLDPLREVLRQFDGS